jgi:site-specific DNA-methyltransferase (adenine-specific)
MKIDYKHTDCINLLANIPDASIDLFLQDLPYGATQNAWDKIPDLDLMWKEWLRTGKQNAAYVFTSQQPFTTDLICSMRKYFRYDIIWVKDGKATGFLNANEMPLRSHEQILVFYRKLPTYNPQKSKGRLNHSKGNNSKGKKQTNNNYGQFNQLHESEATTMKHPKSVVYFPSPHPPIHPTEKPVDLMRYLILTFSNKGETVFDGYAGSAPTAAACVIEDRNFIGAEMHKAYYDIGMERIKEESELKNQLKIEFKL